MQTALINVRFEGLNGHDAERDAMSAHDPKRTLQGGNRSGLSIPTSDARYLT